MRVMSERFRLAALVLCAWSALFVAGIFGMSLPACSAAGPSEDDEEDVDRVEQEVKAKPQVRRDRAKMLRTVHWARGVRLSEFLREEEMPVFGAEFLPGSVRGYGAGVLRQVDGASGLRISECVRGRGLRL
jgi:hypothetical protein